MTISLSDDHWQIFNTAKKHGVALKKLSLLGPMNLEQLLEEISKRSILLIDDPNPQVSQKDDKTTVTDSGPAPNLTWLGLLEKSPSPTDVPASIITATATETGDYIPLPPEVSLSSIHSGPAADGKYLQ